MMILPFIIPLLRPTTPALARPRATLSATTEAEAKYLALPTNIDDARLPVGWFFSPDDGGPRDVCLIFHGAGGVDRETSDLERRVRDIDAAAGVARLVAVYDWSRWLGGQDRAAFDGQAIGRKLGAALRRQEERELLLRGGEGIRTLHVIGTSVGAFAADAFASAYVAAAATTESKARAKVRLTLCDPFTARPGESLGDGWGLQNFGRDADYAEHLLNTDDIVPSTNVPVLGCYVRDVTRSALRRSFSAPNTGKLLNDLGARFLLGHNWPMGFLARTLEVDVDERGHIITPSHDEYPRGVVERVP